MIRKKKRDGILSVHAVLTGTKVWMDLADVRGVAKDYERKGAAIVLTVEGGSFQVNESYSTVYAQIFEYPEERPLA